jgi:hypothetical protein
MNINVSVDKKDSEMCEIDIFLKMGRIFRKWWVMNTGRISSRATTKLIEQVLLKKLMITVMVNKFPEI